MITASIASGRGVQMVSPPQPSSPEFSVWVWNLGHQSIWNLFRLKASQNFELKRKGLNSSPLRRSLSPYATICLVHLLPVSSSASPGVVGGAAFLFGLQSFFLSFLPPGQEVPIYNECLSKISLNKEMFLPEKKLLAVSLENVKIHDQALPTTHHTHTHTACLQWFINSLKSWETLFPPILIKAEQGFSVWDLYGTFQL